MNPRYITEGTLPDGTLALHGEGPFCIFDSVRQDYLPVTFADLVRANVVRDLLNAEHDATNPPKKLMRCTVELLIPMPGSATLDDATDAVSALLTDYAEARDVIRDWRYALDANNNRYLHPVEVDADTWVSEDA